MLKQSAILILALILGLLTIGCTATEAEPVTAQEQPALASTAVEVATAETGDIALIFNYSGNLQSTADIDVQPKVSGEVVEILVTVGDEVEAGDPLARIDDELLRLDLKNEPAVVAAAETMLRRVRDLRPDARIEGFAVQAMAPRAGAIELIMGAKDDPIFGPVIAFGSGGTAVEVLDDVALDLVPLNPHLARGLMARTKAWRLMQGYRNQRPVAVDEAALTLVRLSQLVTDLDRVAELDINPLLATPDGVVALDARVRLAEPRARGVARLAIRPYPQELEGTLRLRDGAALPMRPIRPEDAAGLQAMIEASEVEDLRLRFFSALRRLPPQMAARLTQIDYDREMAFVVLSPDRREVWGTARLHAEPGRERAEYGILVRSDQKGRGLGYLLMQALIAHANRSGLGEIYGEVLAENRRMQEVCASLGFAIDRKDAITDGIVHACLKLQGEREAA